MMCLNHITCVLDSAVERGVMLNQKNILILTSKTGGGHLSLAEALGELLEEDALAPAITIADPQPPLIQQHYRFASRHALWLWAWEFHFLDTPRKAAWVHWWYTQWVKKRLHGLLDAAQPDLIISTYPFLTREISLVQQQRASRVPLALLFADANRLHATWLTERQAAAVFAPTREAAAQALAAGFAPEHLHLVGWPVRGQFTRAALAGAEVCQKMRDLLNLEPERLTIFLQGGSDGGTQLARTLGNILAERDMADRLQIILAAGTNRVLLERYRQVPNLALVPFTHDIAQYMLAADLVMGKAGPNVLMEAMMLGKPFLATSYIPGQEQANLAFIQRHRLGWVALRPEEQRTLLRTLISQPDQLHVLEPSITTYRRWNIRASRRIVPLIRALL